MTEQQIGSRNEKGREESESQGGNIRKWTVISGIRVQAKGKWEKITKKWTDRLGLGGLWAGRRGRPDLDLSDRPLTVSPPAHLTSGCSVTFLFFIFYHVWHHHFFSSLTLTLFTLGELRVHSPCFSSLFFLLFTIWSLSSSPRFCEKRCWTSRRVATTWTPGCKRYY